MAKELEQIIAIGGDIPKRLYPELTNVGHMPDVPLIVKLRSFCSMNNLDLHEIFRPLYFKPLHTACNLIAENSSEEDSDEVSEMVNFLTNGLKRRDELWTVYECTIMHVSGFRMIHLMSKIAEACDCKMPLEEENLDLSADLFVYHLIRTGKHFCRITKPFAQVLGQRGVIINGLISKKTIFKRHATHPHYRTYRFFEEQLGSDVGHLVSSYLDHYTFPLCIKPDYLE